VALFFSGDLVEVLGFETLSMLFAYYWFLCLHGRSNEGLRGSPGVLEMYAASFVDPWRRLP